MNLTTFFTSGGTPALGLTPLISGWKLNGTNVMSAQTMTEIAAGFYTYNFTGYNQTIDYVFRAEDTSLPVGEQYSIATNDVDSLATDGVIKRIYGLVQGNFVMSGQTYDSKGRLTYSDIITYSSSTDVTTDSNREFQYSVNASYDEDGNLTLYKVVEVEIDRLAPITPQGFTITNQSDGYVP